MFEKRIHERSPIELAASYGIGEDPRPEREAKINNISSGGFCFTSDKKIGIGEKTNIRFLKSEVEEAIKRDSI